MRRIQLTKENSVHLRRQNLFRGHLVCGSSVLSKLEEQARDFDAKVTKDVARSKAIPRHI
jgi:hypothetical protein